MNQTKIGVGTNGAKIGGIRAAKYVAAAFALSLSSVAWADPTSCTAVSGTLLSAAVGGDSGCAAVDVGFSNFSSMPVSVATGAGDTPVDFGFQMIGTAPVFSTAPISAPIDDGFADAAFGNNGFVLFSDGLEPNDDPSPEPSTFILLGTALGGIGLLRMRRKRA